MSPRASTSVPVRAPGMSGPALYRYFASRDDLLRSLIRDAYDDIAAAVGHVAANPPDSPAAALHRLAGAYLDWATTEPHRYLLIQGNPIPGYAAPTRHGAPRPCLHGSLREGLRHRPAHRRSPAGRRRDDRLGTPGLVVEGQAAARVARAGGDRPGNRWTRAPGAVSWWPGWW
ncbi:TetR/AcrR family transcriptional regulator [Streptomyces cinnamoneus]|uniref:TetR/AcrR family transcriptional regulator n=1 Tax=Streptomyces cinnamoneus TaxID=53446 RepID=UPI0033D83F85